MQTVHFILLATFAMLSNIAAKNLIEPRIANGQDATEGQFPYMVSLRNRILRGAHICGASMLNSRFLLTRAKCCFYKPETVYAVVGALRVSSGGVNVELDKFMPHEKYDDRNYSSIALYDVGVIRTATKIIFTDYIQPIALSKERLPEDQGVKVILAGWSRQGSGDFVDILQFSEFETISTDECRTRFAGYGWYHPTIQEGTLCAVDKKSDDPLEKIAGVCDGDLGGALVDMTNPNSRTIVGIASFHTIRCGTSLYPAIYSGVHFNLDWIQRQIGSLSSDL